MSGLYIPDETMPECCYVCHLRNQGYSGKGMKCSKTGEIRSWHDSQTSRGSKCPIKFIPDHGPMIDAGKIKYIQVAVLIAGKDERGRQRIAIKSVATPKSIAETSYVIIPEDDVKENSCRERTNGEVFEDLFGHEKALEVSRRLYEHYDLWWDEPYKESMK